MNREPVVHCVWRGWGSVLNFSLDYNTVKLHTVEAKGCNIYETFGRGFEAVYRSRA